MEPSITDTSPSIIFNHAQNQSWVIHSKVFIKFCHSGAALINKKVRTFKYS
jgi:hypothetical protein